MRKNRIHMLVFFIMLIGVIITAYIMNFSSFGEPVLKQYGAGMLDMDFFYTQTYAHKVIVTLGHAGRDFYTRILMVDFVFIICLAYVMATLMCIFIKWLKLPPCYTKLSYIAYIRGIFDALENILLLIVMGTFPKSNQLLFFAGIVTLIKWIAMGIYFIGLAVLPIIKVASSWIRDCKR